MTSVTRQPPGGLGALFIAGLFLAAASVAGLCETNTFYGWHQRSDALAGTIACAPIGLVAVGDDGLIVRSPDGQTWSKADSATTNHLSSVVYLDDRFVAVGNYGEVVTSPDGISWTHQISGTSHGLLSAAVGNGRVVAVGGGSIGGTFTQVVVASTNGVDWQLTREQEGVMFYRVTFGKGRFVAVTAFENTILSSLDGNAWETNTIWAPNQSVTGLTYTGGRFFAVGSATSADNARSAHIWTSDDARTWTDFEAYSGSASMAAVAFGTGLYLAVGVINGKFIPDWPPYPWWPNPPGHWEPDTPLTFTSDDGLHWRRQVNAAPLLYNVISTQQTFMGLGLGIFQTDVLVPRFGPDANLTPTGFQTGIVTEPGQSFQVFTSTNLASWTEQLRVTNAAALTPFLDRAASQAEPKRFYRVHGLGQPAPANTTAHASSIRP